VLKKVEKSPESKRIMPVPVRGPGTEEKLEELNLEQYTTSHDSSYYSSHHEIKQKAAADGDEVKKG